ncbi:uncharacterized protein LOC132701389 isoform X3 [Cylas formicarius]|nr:uncharacterized protein LOC132701389 isoform X3 [Cylas formicarius]XP_060525242.1 uncharacterized protein LOC132701389 isoform X3 [Cylas formicarius]XP_060525243.1 uncharacterized protein LOC132701389 isoform X3 [Cylas formicarius]XP_060525244.1 uncharacterized protein LOC132701389 isoform X3 [Cylas formicarius]
MPQDEYVQKMFNSRISFRNEIRFYTTIAPLFDKYLKDKGVLEGLDFIPQDFGSRLSLDPELDETDDDVVLLLENIKVLGYQTENKLVGLDLTSAKIILDVLAKFHATGLGLKIEKPKEFKENVLQYVWDYEEDDEYLKVIKRELRTILRETKFSEEVINRAVSTIDRKANFKSREPWSTLIHYDCWINNTMLKFKNGKADRAMLVDFQLISYKSPARDVLFFIFTSLQNDVLEQNLDALLEFYYEQFSDRLKRLNIDTSRFSKESFYEELKIAARENEYYHIIFMLPPILEEEFKELTDFEKEVNWTKNHRERIVFVTKEFVKRGWLL